MNTRTFLLSFALLLAPVVAHADTVYGEHTWSGSTFTSGDKFLRMSAGVHKVVAKADSAIICGVVVPETKTILSVSHSAAGQECITAWKQTESGTVVHFITFDSERATSADYHKVTYMVEFRSK